MSADAPRSSNVVWQRGELNREQRWAALGHGGATIWIRAPSGSVAESKGCSRLIP